MKTILTILLLLFFFNCSAQLEKPDVFISQTEMTPSGGQVYDEFYWFNTLSANLTKTSVSFTGGTYRFDLSAYNTAGNAQVGMYIDGVLKGTITVTSTAIAIYSLPTLTISAGSHDVKIQINNFSGSTHCRVGLLYFTLSALTAPYVYPTVTPIALSGLLTKEHFASGVLRGFNLGSNGTNGAGEPITSMTGMKATGANIARCFVQIERLSGDTYTFKSGELTKLATTVSRGTSLGFYVVPVLYHDPALNTDYWGNTARKASIVSLWQTLATTYNGNTTVAAYDLINEPRSNFNYAEVIKWETDMIDAIRAIDPNHVIAVECVNNDMFAMMLPLGYTNIIYSPHGYSTSKITFQGIPGTGSPVRNKYPTLTSTSNLASPWNISNLSAQHDDVRIMSNRFHVPVFVGEFSCVNWAPLNDAGEWTSTKWINDNISLLEAERWSWAYNDWVRGGEYIGWDPEIPSQWYATNSTFTNAEPSPKPAAGSSGNRSVNGSATAPTIVMLEGWFGLNSVSGNYYFSSSTGSDLNDGSIGTPFQTITKLNAMLATASPGSHFLLKRGDTFTGTITPTANGNATDPIFIEAYGSGDNPVVTQMTTLSSWTSLGGNIWESAAITTSIVPNVVTVNDEMVGKGRYPNDNAANGGYLTVSTGGSTSVTVLTLPTTINYTGAEAVMRTTHWQLDRNTITGHNTTSHILTYTNSTGLSMPANYGLFIQNHVSTLDKQNEWYYNPSTKKLRIYSTTNPGSTVKVATGNNLFVANPRSYITVQNITFNGCNEQGISLKGGTDIIIQNCKVKNIGMDGFVLAGAKRATILNDTITNIANRAIRDSASSHRTIIKNNYIRNNAYIAGLQKTNANNHNAISLDATNDTVLVQGNTIINSGGGGINFRSSDSLWIRNNLIDTFAFVIDDIGGIYGYLGGSTPEAPGALKTKRIRGNIIRNGIGAGLGTAASGALFSSAYAMYWDNTIGNIYADSNHVHQGGRAATYYHTLTHHITMKDNTFDSTQYLLYILRDSANDITNNVFQRNILFTRGSFKASASSLGPGRAIFFENFQSSTRATFGSIDSNHIAHLNTDTPFVIHSKSGTTKYFFSTWKTATSFDTHSDTFQTVSTSVIREDYSTAASNILNLGSYNWLDAKHTFYPKGTYTLNPWKGSVLARWTLTGITPPTCVITTPINGQGYTTPGNVTIVASATDNDGVITQVEFFLDGVSINVDNTSPYSYNLTGLSAGTYVLTAAATDNDGLITTSNPVTITVSNPLPVVTITSPPNGQTYTAPATVVLAASASIATGTITRVDFFRNGVFIGTDASSPYTVTQSGVTTGGWCYTAVAVSSYGDSTTSTSVCVQVSAANIPPTISITSPPTNSTYTAPATINFSASAGDADGTVTRVNFFNGTTFIGTDISTPYTFTWTGVTAGTYTIRATAKDNSGDSTTSAPITVIVNNPANVLPVVTITSPTGGASFYSPGAFTLTGTATDADGTITTTKLYQDGVLVGTDASSPYSFNISGLVAGGYVFIFRGFDNSGDSASALVNITVVDSVSNPPDTIPPLLINAVINNPILCAGGQATVTVSATGGEEPYSGDIGVHLETAGIKTYIVNDNAGNADTLVIAINEPGVLSATATLAPIQKYKGFGTVVINAIGGTGPYQYSINGGTTWQTSNTFKLKAGNYTVTVRDANGCTTSVSFSLTQPKPGSNFIIHSATTYINL